MGQITSEFEIKKLEDYIFVLKNIVPKSICDEIIEEYKDSEDFSSALIGSGENKDIRDCFNLPMSTQEIINKNYNKRKKLDEELYIIAQQAVNQYCKLFYNATNFAGDSGYTLLKYEVGGNYKYHVDDSNLTPRKLSLSLTLNDEFEGGEFVFFYGHKIYKLNKGDGIIFPSNFMYPHAVLPITSGVRYSIVTWFI
jgi:hypothetical protein